MTQEQLSASYFENQLKKLIQDAHEHDQEDTFWDDWIVSMLETLEELSSRNQLKDENNEVIPVDRLLRYLSKLIANEKFEHCDPHYPYAVVSRRGITKYTHRIDRQGYKKLEEAQSKFIEEPICNKITHGVTNSIVPEPTVAYYFEPSLHMQGNDKQQALISLRKFISDSLQLSDDNFAKQFEYELVNRMSICELRTEGIKMFNKFGDDHDKGIHDNEWCHNVATGLHQYQDGRWKVPDDWKPEIREMAKQVDGETLSHIGEIFIFARLKKYEKQYGLGKPIRFNKREVMPWIISGKWVSKVRGERKPEEMNIISPDGNTATDETATTT